MLVEIFHDTACPWCRIGIKSLFDALDQWQNEPVTLKWHPFFLDATIPSQGVAFDSFMQTRKGIDSAQLTQLLNYVQKRGESIGIRFNFDEVSLAVNTELSHRLIAIAPEAQKRAVVEGIYRTYFEEGLNIGDLEVAIALGTAIGIDPEMLRTALSGDAAQEIVVNEATQARQQGITSVPFFVINNEITVQGSQSPGTFLRSLNRAALLATLNPPYWS